ncbi:MAG: hypothetical protein Q8O40_14250 [Chloroflexota bacterium]|nr:hypothetical protein [Chloroflexota bacterium]
MSTSLPRYRYNLDGVLFYSERKDNVFDGYVQMFRSGIVEAACSDFLGEHEGERFIPSVSFEKDILATASYYLTLLGALEVEPPLALMLSLLDVRGVVMGVSREHYIGGHRRPPPIDRDSLILPDVLVEDRSHDIGKLLRPTFDSIWNAAGWERSLNYDDKGNWRPHSR